MVGFVLAYAEASCGEHKGREAVQQSVAAQHHPEIPYNRHPFEFRTQGTSDASRNQLTHWPNWPASHQTLNWIVCVEMQAHLVAFTR